MVPPPGTAVQRVSSRSVRETADGPIYDLRRGAALMATSAHPLRGDGGDRPARLARAPERADRLLPPLPDARLPAALGGPPGVARPRTKDLPGPRRARAGRRRGHRLLLLRDRAGCASPTRSCSTSDAPLHPARRARLAARAHPAAALGRPPARLHRAALHPAARHRRLRAGGSRGPRLGAAGVGRAGRHPAPHAHRAGDAHRLLLRPGRLDGRAAARPRLLAHALGPHLGRAAPDGGASPRRASSR